MSRAPSVSESGVSMEEEEYEEEEENDLLGRDGSAMLPPNGRCIAAINLMTLHS